MRASHRVLLSLFVLVALAAPGHARAGGNMYVGAVENAPLQADLVSAKAKMELAKLAGFDSLRIAMFWAPGRASIIPDWDRETLLNANAAANLTGIRLIVSASNLN